MPPAKKVEEPTLGKDEPTQELPQSQANTDSKSEKTLADLSEEVSPQNPKPNPQEEEPTFSIEEEKSQEGDEPQEETLKTTEVSPQTSPTRDQGTRQNPYVSSYNQGNKMYSSNQPVFTTQKPSGGNKLHLVILALIGLLVIGATVVLLKGGDNLNFFAKKPAKTPTPAPISISSPTPTPAPIFDRSQFSIRVLNGTSTSGLAATVSNRLKDLGYKIEKVGNATNSAFKRTQIRVKTDSEGLHGQLIKDLSPDYDATSAGSLKTSEDVDGEVVLGLK